MQQRTLEILVGLFMLLSLISGLGLAFKVSGISNFWNEEGYTIVANFSNIGDLKPRAPVTLAGVRVGQIVKIKLNPQSYEAEVVMRINKNFQNLPTDSSASIFTEGLLGSNYISIEPGYAQTNLKSGDRITQTHSALILENLIGQFLFKVNNENKNNKG